MATLYLYGMGGGEGSGVQGQPYHNATLSSIWAIENKINLELESG